MITGLVPTRAIVAIMIFNACMITYMLRANMSMNIIAMTNRSENSPLAKSECLRQQNKTLNETLQERSLTVDHGERYNWNSKIQGYILGSYFWGYTITCIPGGFVAERIGPRKTIAITTAASAGLTFLTPIAASWHYITVIIIRFALGFVAGGIYPALHCLISRWAPPNEKGKFVGTLLGGQLGTVLTWPICGALIETWGWKYAFYVPGFIALFWCFSWWYLVTDTPEEHPQMDESEKKYVMQSIGDTISKTKKIPPYMKIFSSVPFWAFVVLQFGSLWGLYFLFTIGPKYMTKVLGFDLSQSGTLAAVPYLARLICGFVFGYVGDCIRKSNRLSVTNIRKIFVTFSHFLPGLFLLAQTMVGCNATLAIVLISLSLGSNGASTVTVFQNSHDLAPNFAGSLYGIVNCIGSTAGFITPMLTGYITAGSAGQDEWHTVFWIGAAVYIACGIFFCIFGSGEQQEWNNTTSSNNENNNEKGVDNRAFEKGGEIESTKI